MKSKKHTRIAGLALLSGLLASPLAFGQAQSLISIPPVNGDNGGLINQNNSPTVFVGPQPSTDESHINDYTNQNDQMNLDANAGNVRVLRTSQKALLNDFVTALIEVKDVDVREIRNAIRTICGLEGGRAEVVIHYIVDKDGKPVPDKDGKPQIEKKFVQVICPKFQLPYLQKAIAALDKAWVGEENTGSVTFYYKAKNRNAAGIDFIASHYASETSATGAFTVIDTTNNAVTRLEEAFRADKYMEAAKQIDIPANQVSLDVKVVELNSNNDLKLGLDYINWKNGPGRSLWEFVSSGLLHAESRNKTLTSIYDPVTFGFAGSSGAAVLKAEFEQSYRAVNYLLTSNYIDFLQVKGQARVMTQQSLRVKSANTATIATNDVIVATTSSPSDLDTVGADTHQGISATDLEGIRVSKPSEESIFTVPVRDYDRRLHHRPAGSTGLFLAVTPFVGLESMELVLNISNADLNGVAPNGQPLINNREITTTIRLMDGEPYVISGLKRKHDIRETGKVPGLGDIPIIGYLAGGENNIQRENDVVIIVTPHFQLASQADIKNPQEVKDLAEAVGGAPSKLPSNPYGYDQWLLDPNAN